MRSCVAVAALTLVACGPPSDLCKGVTCPKTQTCDPDIGQCKPNLGVGGGGGADAGAGGGSATGGGGGGSATGGGGATGGGSATGGGGSATGGGGSASGGGSAAGGGTAVTNDTCASPKVIVFDGGFFDGGQVVTFTADLGTATDDYHGSCSSSFGGDLVYRLNVTSAQDILISAHGGGSDPAIYVGQSPCQSADGGYTPFRDACADRTSVNETETLVLRNVQPGVYFLFVDAYTPSSAGTPQVTIRTGPAQTAVPGDLCTAPLALFADGGAQDTVTATTRGAIDDSTSECSLNAGTDGGDVYFGFTTTSSRRFAATATPPLTWDGGLRPELYLSPAADCATGVLDSTAPRLGCSVAAGPEQPGELVIDALPAGQWILTVDSHRDESASPTWGGFTLSASLSPPGTAGSNEACASAVALTLGAGPYAGTSAFGVVESTLAGAANDQQLTCNGQLQSGPDLAWRVTTGATAGPDGGIVVKATVSSSDFTSLLPTVFLQRTCGADAGSSCNQAASTVSETSNVAAAYLVAPANTALTAWVDTAGAGGPFSLRLQTATPPANERCAAAISLPLNASLAGTTLGAANDYDSNGVIDVQGVNDCFDDLFGADVVYAFTAPTTGTYLVKMQPEPQFNAALGIVTDCNSVNACVATADNWPESWEETVSFAAAQGVTYFIIADGFSDDLTQPGARGGFIISVSQ
ncbi:MAG: hypothetical protein QM723_32280 [Myxococcaceae bacterium]